MKETIVYTEIQAVGADAGYLLAIADRGVDSEAILINPTTNESVFKISVPTADASCWAVSPDLSELIWASWDTGVVGSASGCFNTRLEDISSVGFLDAERLVATTSSEEIFIIDEKGGHTFLKHSDGCIVRNFGWAYIEERNNSYYIWNTEADGPLCAIPVSGLGIVDVFCFNSLLLITQARGNVDFIDGTTGINHLELPCPSGRNPIKSGYNKSTGHIYKLESILGSNERSNLSAYTAEGVSIGEVAIPLAPPVACFSPALNGFVTGSGDLVEFDFQLMKARIRGVSWKKDVNP